MTSISPSNVPELPFELWEIISSHLPNRDIKSMRLACKQFSNAARLRIQRVFLSANPLNIEVFRAIADHKTFRLRVTEIIWDDARFLKGPRRLTSPPDWDDELISDEDKTEDEHDYGPWHEKHDEEYPRWFKMACQENLDELSQRKGRDVDRPDHIARAEQVAAQLPLNECWEYYQNLLRQQANVLAANEDEEAFLYGLKQFPALKRITITPAAHGVLFAPLYPSSMIRAFPKGFNYPIPRTWPMPTTFDTEMPPLAYTWQRLDEAHKDKYRGFRIVTRVLAKMKHNVSELVINPNQLPTGLNCTILDHPCEEYNNLATLLKQPRFRRLDLAFIVRGIEREDLNWRSFRNGNLHRALSEARDMEDIRLCTTGPPRKVYGAGPARDFIPLLSIFPVEKWPKLRHFELSRFLVVQADVISLLSALPETIRSIQLSNLKFLDNGGTWYDLLTEMRRQIRGNAPWPDRGTASWPQVTIVFSSYNALCGRGTWLEQEIYDFLYREGENPFYNPPTTGVRYGFGTERDAFEPSYDRPHIHGRTLREKGYVK